MANTGSQIPSPDEIRALREKLSKPIDFDALIEQGVLEKSGAWYVVKDMNKLPDYAQAQISGLQTHKNGIKVKF